MQGGGRRVHVDRLVAIALAVASFLLYARTFTFGFLDWDDPQYVTGNPVVQRGLTLEGVRWAFTTTHFANWLPVTWVSHMTDVALWGLNGGGHHATNAALHAANAALLFVLLRQLTGWRWRSLAAAALFAAHPLRVESVAWIAERKDVLAGTFFLLTLLAYVGYARRPSVARYALVAFLLALGLMAKTMLVTLPCVLLLLDWWPLDRWRRTDASEGDAGDAPAAPAPPGINPTAPPPLAASRPLPWLALEKLPLLALALIASAWTYFFQFKGGAARDDFTLAQRLANAVVSVPRYLGKTLWPSDLSPFYPHPGDWPAWAVIASVALTLALTWGAWRVRRAAPYVTVGWLWFLGMLVPVSGVIQAGNQSIADRYTYLPGIGLTVAAVWAVADLRPRFPSLRQWAAPAAAALVVVLGILSILQQRHWRTTRGLFEHALAVDERNWMAHTWVGLARVADGDPAAAVRHFRRSIELNPSYTNTYLQLAQLQQQLGQPNDALAVLREAARRDPSSAEARVMIGNTLSQQGQYAEADAAYDEARRLAPGDAAVYVQWGVSRVNRGDPAAAADLFDQALRLEPGNPMAREGVRIVKLMSAAATRPAGAGR